MDESAAAPFLRVHDLVDAGVLPKSAIQRMAYVGHPTVHLYGQSAERRAYKCVGCGESWVGRREHSCEATEVYVTNHLRTARWRCRTCAHQWDGEDGVRCPACSDCAHEWGEVACNCCGKDKDEYMSELPEGQRPTGWVPGYYHALAAAKKDT